MRNLNNKTNNNNRINKLCHIVVWTSLVMILNGCSTYKASCDCPKIKGIGCSSLEYADEIARKQILLNSGKKEKKEVLIKKGKNNFEIDELY